MNIQIAGGQRNADPRSRTNFTASSLYSRLNFLRCIQALLFHLKHLNLMSTKPAEGHSLKQQFKALAV